MGVDEEITLNSVADMSQKNGTPEEKAANKETKSIDQNVLNQFVEPVPPSNAFSKHFTNSKIFGSQKVKAKNCINLLSSACPVVSFINKGDGLVSVDLLNRVMVNENELYSINVATSNFSSFHSLSNLPSSLSFKSTPILQTHSSDKLECDTLPEWFAGSICRAAATSILHKQPIGAFIVRESATKPGCYALSVRVPKMCHLTGVAHYLIIRNSSGTFKIKVQNTV